MDWKDLGKSLISQGVPLLGGLLGGPAGATAGKMVASLFGADPEKPEDIMNKMQLDANAIQKLREFEMNHQLELQRLQLAETQAFLNDVDSARKREADIAKSTGKMDVHLYILSYVVTASFFLLAAYLFYGVISSKEGTGIEKLSTNSLVMLIIGALISGFTQVLSYFFGSSKGSAEKNKIFAAKG